MIFLLESSLQGNFIILFVFAVIVLVLGIYVLYTANVMMKTLTPPAFLIPEQEIARIKQPEEYCKEARSRVIGIGIVCIAYGIFEMLETFFIGIYIVKVIGAVGLFALIIVLFYGLSRIRTKYTA